MTKSIHCIFAQTVRSQNNAKNTEISDLKNTILNKLLILLMNIVVNSKNRLLTYKILKKNFSQLPYLFTVKLSRNTVLPFLANTVQ